MEENNMIRTRRPVSDMMFVPMLLSVALMLLGQLIGMLPLVFTMMTSTSPAEITATQYISFWGIWAVVCLYMLLVKKNRPIFSALGRRAAGNNWKGFLLGLLFGFGLNGFCILIAWLHKDIYLTFDSFRPVSFVLVFLCVFVQSSAEELLCRGFLYQRLRKGYRSPLVAILGNSALFAALHLFNEGVTVLSVINIFVVGVFFSLMVYYMDSIWCAMAAHTAWNFCQNIIFGLPNSGIVVPYSVFKLDASTAMDSFAYNVGFGIEGTILADAVLILATVLLWLWGRKYGKKPLDVWHTL